MSLKIIGRQSDPNGGNTHYKLSNGNTVDRATAVAMCRQGMLPDYEIIEVNGVEYLRDKPDDRKDDNINEQPKV